MVKKTRILLLLLFLLTCTQWVMGQDTSTNARTPAQAVDSLLARVEEARISLDRINAVNRRGFSTSSVEQSLPEIAANLHTIQQNLLFYSRVIDIKNLQMYKVLLNNMQQVLNERRTILSGFNRELISMNAEINSFSSDTLLLALSTDSLFTTLYRNELGLLKEQWQLASGATSQNLEKINKIQSDLSGLYFLTNELQSRVDELLRAYNSRNFTREYAYIWNAADHAVEEEHLSYMLRKSYEGQQQLLTYYFLENWHNWLWLLGITLLFIWWVFTNYRKIKQNNRNMVVAYKQIKYLKPVPILSALVLALNIAPFFDLHPPTAYVEIMQFFLMLALTVLFWRNWPRHLFFYWIAIFILFIIFAVSSSIINPSPALRVGLLIFNCISVVFGLFFTWHIRQALSLAGFVKYVSVIYIVLNVLAILFNIFGRLTLAKITSTTAIFGLTQIIGLQILVELITEAFFLQIEASKLSDNTESRFNFDYQKMEATATKILSSLVVVFWLAIFTTNLNIYTPIYSVLEEFLTKTRTLGSITFTIGNVLLFFGILYLANNLQKYVGYFFGVRNNDFITGRNIKGSRMVIVRLVLMVAGFLLAISASGMPLTNITVVLGALGVGIGLGLQNIVNNLVSGIILIFERPFELGDSIEIGTKKGRVKDIGIRSSRLVTTEGSEVIVPNGDLLSGQVTNWTLNNRNVRVELLIKVDPNTDFEQLKKLIREEVEKSPNVLKRIAPDILLNNITSTFLELKILFWVTNIRQDQAARSEVLLRIYKRLTQQEIKLL
ncbi:mechanosensitive ion channel [Pontibacter qinzhouensis]|uniref:Mechanosensitive ion channel n=1 Tax=Pontibacter qinzhouensis TaxID=2603253 RepID=A0A5C8JLI1_9BACT|nr:mechanosensitive ion channel domain-containing protein [Pontibacter qinzhouensis]TXK37886.1 mechanosensitive ion channel [Pontibacter qinzhouensis]